MKNLLWLFLLANLFCFGVAEAAGHPVIAGLKRSQVAAMNFYYPSSYTERVQPLLAIAGEQRQKIESDLRSGLLTGTHIYLLPKLEDYFEARGEPPRSPHWATGLAILQQRVILIRLEALPGGHLELDRTLAHELSHIALHRHVQGGDLPHWFVEGFALLQTETWNMDRVKPLAEAALGGELIPLQQLDHGFPEHAGHAQLAYAESGHFVRWTINEFGRPKFRQWLKMLGEGKDFYAAFRTVYGIEFASAEQEWRNGLVVKWGWIAVVVAGGTVFFVIAVFFVAAYMRVRRRRRLELQRLVDEPRSQVPPHLQNFGPFGARRE